MGIVCAATPETVKLWYFMRIGQFPLALGTWAHTCALQLAKKLRKRARKGKNGPTICERGRLGQEQRRRGRRLALGHRWPDRQVQGTSTCARHHHQTPNQMLRTMTNHHLLGPILTGPSVIKPL